MKFLLLGASAMAFTLSAPASANPDHWHNKPAVIRAAQVLAKEIEHLDESLHDAGAPAEFVRKVHHTEESVNEFVAMVIGGAAYPQAMQEFNHIREDIRFIETEFSKHPHLFSHPKVASEWRATRMAYRKLDHEMLRERGVNVADNVDIDGALADLHASIR